MKNRKIILKSSLIILYCLLLAALVYLGDFYRGDEMAYQALLPDKHIEVRDEKDCLVFIPEDEKTDSGFVFYPGGKVEAQAYAPLMRSIAQKGVVVIVAKMPFNLAVLSPNKAEKMMEDYKSLGVRHWFIGGHSLGGAMASDFAVETPQKLEGVILMGAYPNKSQENLELLCLTIVGSEDGIVNWTAFEEAQFSKQREIIIIDGGNHSYFGNYGLQEGDNEGGISREEQQERTADAIAALIKEGVN